MRFNFSTATSTIALAITSLLVGCGGGSSDGDAQSSITSSSSGSTSAASTAASANDTAINTGTTTTTTTADTDSTDSVTQAARVAVASATRSGVGTSLTAINYWSGEYPTVDFMKKAGGWLTQCDQSINASCKVSTWDTNEEAQLDLDADGWIRSLPASNSSAAYRYATTVVISGGTQPIGKYIVRYDGQGTLTYNGIASKSTSESTAGRDVVNVVAGTGVFLVTETATTPSNYLRNIRIYPPGGACASDLTTWVQSAADCSTAKSKGLYVAFENFPATSPYFPTFLKDITGFRTLRFMDWGNTNGSNVKTWADRTTTTNRTWSGNAGVPIETMFDLAKAAGADPWLNIPPYVDDDYIHQFGKLAHTKLAAGQTLNLEYANEMWNYSFPATQWALAQAKTLYAANVAQGADQNVLMYNWYAQRLVQACTIVKAEFGADASRVRCIANTQVGNTWEENHVLSCQYAGGQCAKAIDVVAVAPYFGIYISDAANRPTITNWYADADGGLAKMFQEIVGNDTSSASATSAAAPLATTSQNPGGALTTTKNLVVASKTIADKYSKPMWAYEGGQSLTPNGDTKLQALMTAANRDARMGAAYQAMMQDWVAAGGQTFALFTDISAASPYGFWGMRESQFDTAANAPKWATALRWRDTVKCWWTGC